MNRTDYLIFLLAGLLLLASVGLRSVVGTDARWSPALLLFGFNFLSLALVRHRRRQDKADADCP